MAQRYSSNKTAVVPLRTSPALPPLKIIGDITNITRRGTHAVAEIAGIDRAGVVRAQHLPEIPVRGGAASLAVEELDESWPGGCALDAVLNLEENDISMGCEETRKIESGMLVVRATYHLSYRTQNIRWVKSLVGRVVALHDPAVLNTVVRAAHVYITAALLQNDCQDDSGVDLGCLADRDNGLLHSLDLLVGVADGN